MLLTEQEAREKACRAAGAAVALVEARRVGAQSGYISTTEARCIASDCMMWRWSRAPEKRPRGIIETDAMVRQVHRDIPTECNPRVVGDEIIADGIGYCGLAGKPESA